MKSKPPAAGRLMISVLSKENRRRMPTRRNFLKTATLAGLSLTRLLDEPTRRRLSTRIAALWPPGPYALATAATMVIEAMAGRSRRIASCFVAPDPSEGRKTRAAALPVRLNGGGIAEVVMPALSRIEQVGLDNAMML